MSEFVIEPLTKNHLRDKFDCGEESLNVFLKQFARQNAEKGFGRTYVVIAPGEKTVLGYYTISSGSVRFENIPVKLPKYPVPTVHLGRLAVDISAKGQRLGEMLLIDAMARTVSISDRLGIFALEVFALNEAAKKFYLKYGFVGLLDDERHLYLPISTIRKLGL